MRVGVFFWTQCSSIPQSFLLHTVSCECDWQSEARGIVEQCGQVKCGEMVMWKGFVLTDVLKTYKCLYDTSYVNRLTLSLTNHPPFDTITCNFHISTFKCVVWHSQETFRCVICRVKVDAMWTTCFTGIITNMISQYSPASEYWPKLLRDVWD